SIATPAAAPIAVTLTSANPALLLLSSSATTLGSDTITVTIPAGAASVPYYLQALADAGTTTYQASAPGSGIADSDNLVVNLAPSGAVFSGMPFLFANVGGPPVAVAVALSALNPDNTSTGNYQPLRGGLAPVQITLQSSLPTVGSI